MKLYIVTETNKQDNLLLRSWVCFTKEQANECLKKRYDIACAFNAASSKANPTNCLSSGFFFWEMETITLRYCIKESNTFAE